MRWCYLCRPTENTAAAAAAASAPGAADFALWLVQRSRKLWPWSLCEENCAHCAHSSAKTQRTHTHNQLYVAINVMTLSNVAWPKNMCSLDLECVEFSRAANAWVSGGLSACGMCEWHFNEDSSAQMYENGLRFKTRPNFIKTIWTRVFTFSPQNRLQKKTPNPYFDALASASYARLTAIKCDAS